MKSSHYTRVRVAARAQTEKANEKAALHSIGVSVLPNSLLIGFKTGSNCLLVETRVFL